MAGVASESRWEAKGTFYMAVAREEDAKVETPQINREKKWEELKYIVCF